MTRAGVQAAVLLEIIVLWFMAAFIRQGFVEP